MSTKKPPLSKTSIGLSLQDAYWYADQAAGRNETQMAPTRSEALARCVLACRAAGLRLSTTLFPRTLASAQAIQDAIERWGVEQGVDARTGEVLAELVAGGKARDAVRGDVVTIRSLALGTINIASVTDSQGRRRGGVAVRNLRPLAKGEHDGQVVNAARGALPEASA